VLALLSLLLVITYLDRVCISVAGPRIQEALHIGPLQWGWVLGIFTIAYAVFEIPSGMLGDRIGPRKVLTRIVIWWSIFTSLTGLATGLYPLMAIRFLFGVGEAGAFPCSSVAIARWFPVTERGRACGIVLTAIQVGGALTPLIVVPIQIRYGWRASFYIFGIFGVLWSLVWYWWFRDSPAEKEGVSSAELAETRGLIAKAEHALPWKTALRSANLWATLGVAFSYIYTFNFFQSWFHTYLVKAHGFSESNLLLSSLPFAVAGVGSLAGGLVSNRIVQRIGLLWGRRAIGVAGLSFATLCAVAVPFTHNWLAVLVLLSLTYAGITFQQPTMFAVCLDIGGEYAGAVVGAMNTSSQLGALCSSVVFGWIVARFGSYQLPFLPMILLLAVGALLWLKIDPREQLIPAAQLPLPVTAA
jgi:ACS family glucarate transporter-like MFS transporter